MILSHVLLLAPAVLLIVGAFAQPGSMFALSKPIPDPIPFRIFSIGFGLIAIGVAFSWLRGPYLDYAFIVVFVLTVATMIVRRFVAPAV